MSKMLPYPGRYESDSSWEFRCKQWENNRSERNRELNARSTNWSGYNYRPVVVGGEYRLPDGRAVTVEKTFPSRSKLDRAKSFARRNFLVLLKVQLGNPNVITSREDFLAVKPENALVGLEVIPVGRAPEGGWKQRSMDRVYNCDKH